MSAEWFHDAETEHGLERNCLTTYAEPLLSTVQYEKGFEMSENNKAADGTEDTTQGAGEPQDQQNAANQPSGNDTGDNRLTTTLTVTGTDAAATVKAAGDAAGDGSAE